MKSGKESLQKPEKTEDETAADEKGNEVGEFQLK